MIWAVVRFGKYRGKKYTLPMIIFMDLDWFFWAVENDVFKGPLLKEAEDLSYKCRHILIPNNENGYYVAEYWLHPSSGSFTKLRIVPKNSREHSGSSETFRKKFIDLSFPRSIARYDKSGNRIIISHIKYVRIGRDIKRMTKKLAEDFFNNPANFAPYGIEDDYDD